MKIAIVGAGITGAYLYRLLNTEGYDIDIFDLKNGTKCGMHPCAWGTSEDFFELVRTTGLDPQEYILRHLDHVIIDEVKMDAKLMTIDKPQFLKSLLEGAEIRYSPLDPSRYSRVIDATGVSRAFLPSIKYDLVSNCAQYRFKTSENLPNRLKLGRIGYAWTFPLSHKEYHIGCGSLNEDIHQILADLDWLNSSSGNNRKLICRCEAKIRLASPYYSQPFVTHNGTTAIWGVGEAIGCVAPLAGDGIVPGMKSVQLLLNHWDRPQDYSEAILKDFQWMLEERRVVDKLRTKEPLGFDDARVLKRNLKRMNMQVGLKQAAMLLRHLR